MLTKRARAGLRAASLLVNTAGPPERLDESSLAEIWATTGHRGPLPTGQSTAGLCALREQVLELFGADPQRAAEVANQMLRDARATPYVIANEGSWVLGANPGTSSLAAILAVEIATCIAAVLGCGELNRLRTCARVSCTRVLVDLSRNRSRRFCSTNCGNAVAAAAYRDRRARNVPTI